MDSFSLIILLDKTGFKDFQQCLINKDSKEEDNCENKYSLVLPPPYLQNFEKIKNEVSCWVDINKINNIIKEKLDCILEQNNGFTETIENGEIEFMADCIHHFTNQLSTSIGIVQVYLFSGEFSLQMKYKEACLLLDFLKGPSDILSIIREVFLPLVAALKRLEVWNNALFSITSSCKDKMQTLHANLSEFIDIKIDDNFQKAFERQTKLIWGGRINFLLKKSGGVVPIGQYIIESTDNVIHKDLFFLERHGAEKLVIDGQMQILAMVKQENIPLHYVIPKQFYLKSFKSTKKNSLKDLLQAECWWVGVVKFDHVHENSIKARVTNDWESHVNNDFTQYLAYEPAVPSSKLSKHFVVLIGACPNNEDVATLYFMRQKETLNENGAVFSLMEQNQHGLCFEDVSCEEGLEWQCWIAKENNSKDSRSIARCRSADFYLNGVAISVPDPLSEDSVRSINETFSHLLNLFDTTSGRVRTQPTRLLPIPVIPDRLLKNIKTEDEVKMLDFHQAEQLIAHGIEYCVDSFSALRLDNRLTKVQRKYIPEDTVNLTSLQTKPTNVNYFQAKSTDDTNSLKTKSTDNANSLQAKSTDNVCSLRTKSTDNVSYSQQSKMKNVSSLQRKPPENHRVSSSQLSSDAAESSSLESRSQRHKRRLRVLVEGVLTKYGRIKKQHPSFKSCCDRLFAIALNEAKNLKSSKGLNEQMKNIIKNHLETVLSEEQVNTSESRLY